MFSIFLSVNLYGINISKSLSHISFLQFISNILIYNCHSVALIADPPFVI